MRNRALWACLLLSACAAEREIPNFEIPRARGVALAAAGDLLWVLVGLLAVLGLWGLLDLLLSGLALRARRWWRRGRRPTFRLRPGGAEEGEGARPLAPMTAAELAISTHLLAMGFEATRSMQGALAFAAELEGAPMGLRERAQRGLAKLRETGDPKEAFAGLAVRPEEARLLRTLSTLWSAREDTVRAALALFEGQMRRRARLVGEARVALLPFWAVVWVLRLGILAGILAPLLPMVRAGWEALPGGWVLYGLLAAGGVLTDRMIVRAVRVFEEALG
jgi:hypothetical protein